jgi:hypothetical protein
MCKIGFKRFVRIFKGPMETLERAHYFEMFSRIGLWCRPRDLKKTQKNDQWDC